MCESSCFNLNPGRSNQFRFNIMVAGPAGSGKTTFLKTLLLSVYSGELNLERKKKGKIKRLLDSIAGPTVEIAELDNFIVEYQQGSVKFTLYDAPGFGDRINNQDSFDIIRNDMKLRHEKFVINKKKFLGSRKENEMDDRIHLCLYFIASHRLKDIDSQFIEQLAELVPITPIISKADTMTKNERLKHMTEVKLCLQKISLSLKARGIQTVVHFEPDWTDEQYLMYGNALNIQTNKKNCNDIDSFAGADFAEAVNARIVTTKIDTSSVPLQSDFSEDFFPQSEERMNSPAKSAESEMISSKINGPNEKDWTNEDYMCASESESCQTEQDLHQDPALKDNFDIYDTCTNEKSHDQQNSVSEQNLSTECFLRVGESLTSCEGKTYFAESALIQTKNSTDYFQRKSKQQVRTLETSANIKKKMLFPTDETKTGVVQKAFKTKKMGEISVNMNSQASTQPTKFPNIFSVITDPSGWREYEYGKACVENDAHSDFPAFKNFLFVSGNLLRIVEETEKKTKLLYESRPVIDAVAFTKILSIFCSTPFLFCAMLLCFVSSLFNARVGPCLSILTLMLAFVPIEYAICALLLCSLKLLNISLMAESTTLKPWYHLSKSELFSIFKGQTFYLAAKCGIAVFLGCSEFYRKKIGEWLLNAIVYLMHMK